MSVQLTWLATNIVAPGKAWPTLRTVMPKTFISIPLKGDDDDTILKNYQAIEPQLEKVNGGNIQLAGLNPLASELTGTIADFPGERADGGVSETAPEDELAARRKNRARRTG